jgi:hypothetical protein
VVLKRSVQIALGILAVLPILSWVVALACLWSRDLVGPRVMRALPIVLALFLLLAFIQGLFYVVWLFRADRVSGWARLLWTLLLLFGNVWTLPAFFWIYIWSGKDSAHMAAVTATPVQQR